MPYDTNNTTIVGRLTRDPEPGVTGNQKQYCRFSIANNQGKDDDPNSVNFFDITAWQKTSEVCAQYLKKGSQVCITGRLAQSRFTDKNGQNRSKVEIIANNVQFIGGKNDSQPRQPSQPSYTPPKQEVVNDFGPENEGDIPF